MSPKNEDASRIRQGHAAENLGLLRRLSVNLLKREPSKLSLKMKRYKAGLDNNFLMKILAASAAEWGVGPGRCIPKRD